MAEYDNDVVAPLLRRRAHLREVGADAAKLAELDHMLRMAGYPADDESSLDSNRVVQEKPGVPRADKENRVMDDDVSQREDSEARARKVAPKERSAVPKQTAAESKPEVKPVTKPALAVPDTEDK